MTLGSRAFVRGFITEFEKSKDITDWEGLWEDGTAWTNKMLGTSSSRRENDFGIIGSVGQGFGYQIQAEWMRIDQVWYNDLLERDDWDFIPWKTDVVIEHENNIDKLVRTLLKLGEISAPLKVGVFYPEPEKEDEYISTGSEIIEKQPVPYPGGVYLLIFGILDEEKGIIWHPYEIDWKGNVFPLHKFLSIKI